MTGGFTIAGTTATRGIADNKAYQVNEELTMVRGRHQIGVGANVAYWKSLQQSFARGGGTWTFNGQTTGLGLADFLLGRVAILEHGGRVGVTIEQQYLGLYAQDAWQATDRVTVNGGVRWEPFFGQNILDGAIANFRADNFRQGLKSTVFRKAPAGFLYPGDPGFPPGKSGFDKQWRNLSPRVGIAWDLFGNGRMAVRSSYGISYDFPVGESWFTLAAAPPYSFRIRVQDPPGRMDDPYGHVGGDPHPIVTSPDTSYPLFGSFGAIVPDMNSPRIQSWNVTVERQIGADWGVSASYLGSYSDRLWGVVALNPGVFLGFDPCTIQGVFYPTCTTNANLNNRRALYLENPQEGQFIADLDRYDDVGTQNYRGLKLSVQRRAASGLSVNANYTWSRCFGLEMPTSSAVASGYTNPAEPDSDRGHCDPDRTHLANLTVGGRTPQFANTLLRALVSDWRASGILSARSGSWLTVTTGRDTAFNGISNQRVSQVSDDVYGAKTVDRYLNRAAFEDPVPGTFGNYVRNSIRGPAFWKVDLAVSRLFSFGTAQNVEIRLEAFNVLNHFNWGNPITNFSAGNFGRIQSQTGDPRILQFGVKYGF